MLFFGIVKKIFSATINILISASIPIYRWRQYTMGNVGEIYQRFNVAL